MKIIEQNTIWKMHLRVRFHANQMIDLELSTLCEVCKGFYYNLKH